MQPALSDGDLVLGWKWTRPVVGDVVIVHTLDRPLIKRLTRIEGQLVWLEGDNAGASTDSRQLGHYHLNDVLAKMIAKF